MQWIRLRCFGERYIYKLILLNEGDFSFNIFYRCVLPSPSRERTSYAKERKNKLLQLSSAGEMLTAFLAMDSQISRGQRNNNKYADMQYLNCYSCKACETVKKSGSDMPPPVNKEPGRLDRQTTRSSGNKQIYNAEKDPTHKDIKVHINS